MRRRQERGLPQGSEKYGGRYPKAIKCLEAGLDDSLTFYSFPELDEKKVSSEEQT